MLEQPGDPTIDTVTSMIEEIVACLVNSRIYAHQHPRVQGPIAAIQRNLLALKDFGQEAVEICTTDGILIYKKRPLFGPSLSSARLLALLDRWSSGGLEIKVHASRDDINRFFSVVSRERPEKEFPSVNEELERTQCNSIRLLPPYQEGLTRAGPGQIAAPLQLYQSIMDLLQTTTIDVCSGGQIDFSGVQEHAVKVLDQLNAQEGPMLSLARQDQYDAFTFGHSVRVAVLAMNFAKALTDDLGLLVQVGTAAILHDVGKSLIPYEILHSRGQLSREERAVMNKHTELGGELLLDHHDAEPLAIATAFGHHCGCVDGHEEDDEARERRKRGYPKVEHGHQISLVTELVKICDVYEALTAARPYKRPMMPARAYRVMLSMKDHFHRPLLRRFLEVNGLWPIGQLVELTSGELARVSGRGVTMMAPKVQIVRDLNGDFLDEGELQFRDLSVQSKSNLCSVLRVADEGLLFTVGG